MSDKNNTGSYLEPESNCRGFSVDIGQLVLKCTQKYNSGNFLWFMWTLIDGILWFVSILFTSWPGRRVHGVI